MGHTVGMRHPDDAAGSEWVPGTAKRSGRSQHQLCVERCGDDFNQCLSEAPKQLCIALHRECREDRPPHVEPRWYSTVMRAKGLFGLTKLTADDRATLRTMYPPLF